MRTRLIFHDLFIMRTKLIFHDLFIMRTELIFGLLGHKALLGHGDSLLGKAIFKKDTDS